MTNESKTDYFNLVLSSVDLELWLKSRDLVLRSVIGPNLVSLSVPLEPWLESRDLALRPVIGPNLVSLSVPLEPWLESRDLVLRSVARPTRSSPTAGSTCKQWLYLEKKHIIKP